MEFHFASVWEAIADVIPESPALACGGVTRAWRAFDTRAACLAAALARAGLGAGAKAAVYLQDSNETLETQFALFKLGGCAVNVDTRHKADELVRLLEIADAEALVYASCFAARIWEVQKRLPKVKCFIEVADGTENIPVRGRIDYENAIRDHAPLPRAGPPPAGASYLCLAGGTTRPPRVLIYRQVEFGAALVRAAFAAQGIDAPASPAALVDGVRALHARGRRPVSLVACPLAHAGGMWLGAFAPLLAGGTVVTMRRSAFDADLTWDEVGERRATDLVIAGDPQARPLLAALDMAAAQGRPCDLSSLRRVVSSGVMWSARTKQRLLAHHDMTLHDVLLAAEGHLGTSIATRGHPVDTACFTRAPGARVLADDGREVQPGSGEVGQLAAGGLLPVAACEMPSAWADPCREVGGVRLGMPGDLAQVAADGSLLLLGRASQCIDTQGGTVFAEAVEDVLTQHPDVLDCLVVGAQDAQGVAQVIALVEVDEALAEAEAETERALLAFACEQLPGHQRPARVLPVLQVRRWTNGKPDYAWARKEWARAASATAAAASDVAAASAGAEHGAGSRLQ